MNAHIITIGDEILIGQIIDTNSAWMAQQLNLQGIRVAEILSISDDKQHILDTLAHSEKNADIVLITGGLGPTKDDITKHTLCHYFDTSLEFKPEIWEHITQLFAKFNRIPTEVQRTQAEQPKTATLLRNKVGTAWGMWFERDGVVFVSMPGVPFEMQYLMEHEVLPRLRNRSDGQAIQHRTIQTACIGESDLAKLIEDIEDNLPPFIKLAYLPALSQVRLRLTGIHTDEPLLAKRLDAEVEAIKQRIAPHIFGYEKDSLQLVVGNLLRESGKTIGTAESCTGGYIAQLLTSIPGSSAYFQGSIVAYSNELKQAILGVSSAILTQHGAVSEETVATMAKKALTVLNVDYAVAVSGIAGPDGGTDEKPVGTIWYALACADGRVVTEKLKFGRDRQKNIQLTGVYALNGLRKFIGESEKR